MASVKLTKDNFEETVEKASMVLVDFWASWCGPCQAFGPVFERVSEKYPDIVFAKVDTDAERELGGAFQIRSIPTLMIFREKIVIYAQPGALPESALVELIEKAKMVDMEEVRREIAEMDQDEP